MQQDELIIRDLQDLDSDYQLAFDAMRDIYGSTEMMCQPFEQKYPDFESFKSSVRNGNECAGAIFIMAESNAECVGYITVSPVPATKLAHTAYLNMGIRESQRGKSLGRRLVTAAIERVAAEKIIEIIYLNVRADNEPAVKLYESAGFDTIAVLTRDTKIGNEYYDGLLMRRFI